jgi:uncharacterized membrane protein
MALREWVELAGDLMEGAGVAVMILGAVLSLARLAVRWGRPRAVSPYEQLRQNLGRAILLGLEFLVAADIIRSVSKEPTLEAVTVLGIIVLIRTFLSFTLTVELEGRWPWQRGPEPAEVRAPPPSAPPSQPPERPRLEPERHPEH